MAGDSISRRAIVAGSVGLATILGAPRGVNRQRVLTSLDDATGSTGLYTAYELDWKEYIGRRSNGNADGELAGAGYERNPLSATKYHPGTGETHDGSWRRVDPENPRWQWHVHVWDRDRGVQDIFSHYEYRPDPVPLEDESLGEVRTRLRHHYDPKWDLNHPPHEANYFLGDACERVRALVG